MSIEPCGIKGSHALFWRSIAILKWISGYSRLAVADVGVNGAVSPGGLVAVTNLAAGLPPGVNATMLLAVFVFVAVPIAPLLTSVAASLAAGPGLGRGGNS